MVIGLDTGACGIIGPDWERKVAGLTHPDSVRAPDSVRSSTPFVVTMTTETLRYCGRADGVEVDVDGPTARVTPYVEERVDVDCAARAKSLHQTATITFEQPGNATVEIVNGRRGLISFPVVVY